jgi:hypothetical protein
VNRGGDRGGAEIVGITVTDNGIGFSDENFEAFCELDTRYKASLGGKGVGRLLWLKVFDRVSIDSIYMSKSRLRRRRFDFMLPGGVENAEDTTLPTEEMVEQATTVTLAGPRDPYRDALHHRATTVRDSIVRHFASYLLLGDAPRIGLVDGEEILAASLNDMIGRVRADFTLGEYVFIIDHLRLQSPADRRHSMHLCADGRVVKSERLTDLPETPLWEGNDRFYYSAFVSSGYLNANVNEQRTGFALEEQTDLLGEVSYSELRAEVGRLAREHLKPCLSELAQARDERVRDVLERRFPEYRYMTEQNGEDLARIPMTATQQQIEEEIAKIHFSNQKNGRELLGEIIQEMQRSSMTDFDSFSQRLEERMEQITRPNQASLASYMLFRRSIVEIYRQLLRKSGDRFELEAAVHRLIFPMGKDHDTSKAFMEHNLWLIDERLTFAEYIASDRQLRKHKVLFDVESGDEPDIVAYYTLTFSSDDPAMGPLHSVVIVELKRPGHLKGSNEDPWRQVTRYILKMREGFYNVAGQKVKASETTRFYCYIICDTDDPNVRGFLLEAQFERLFDGEEGYFLYHRDLRTYAEVRPFTRLLVDAERNHRAFFERLGILTEM